MKDLNFNAIFAMIIMVIIAICFFSMITASSFTTLSVSKTMIIITAIIWTASGINFVCQAVGETWYKN